MEFRKTASSTMTDQECRWLNNVKRAFYNSDQALLSGKPEENCMEELCKGLDVAKTLRLSLRDEDFSSKNNKQKFLEFIHLDVPAPKDGKNQMRLLDARTGKIETYSFAALVYAIRCMAVHENDNLDAAQQPDYHIRLDWNMPTPENWLGVIEDGRVTINARIFSHRLREILAGFITGIESMISFAQDGRFNISSDPPLGAIRPA